MGFLERDTNKNKKTDDNPLQKGISSVGIAKEDVRTVTLVVRQGRGKAPGLIQGSVDEVEAQLHKTSRVDVISASAELGQRITQVGPDGVKKIDKGTKLSIKPFRWRNGRNR